MPDKSIHFKSESCIGGKHSKVRLTGIAAAIAVGEKLPMFVIGKSKKQRCFNRIGSLSCRYRHQKKSWMSGELFQEWVEELDNKFLAKKRKVALVIENCPAHPEVESNQACVLAAKHNIKDPSNGSRGNP